MKLFLNLYICLVFCIAKCFANYILESQFDDLRESMKHFLDYKKNLSLIPHDCTDRPFVEIDAVFEENSSNGSKYYAVYGNQSYFVEIQGITRDHLPIIHRDTQPMPVDSRFKRKMTGKRNINEYRFVGPIYLHKIANENDKYSLVGFNQVWVGCPQPLCISPGFDGILSLSSISDPSVPMRSHMNLLLLFRGNYFWYYDFATNKSPIHPPLTDSAIRIEERFVDRRAVTYNYQRTQRGRPQMIPNNGYLNDSMVVPTYIDAIAPGINKYNNCLYFFKNDTFVCYEWFSKLSTPMKIADEFQSSDKSWMSAKIDAAFYSNSLTYFIAEEQIWCFTNNRMSCHSYPKNLKDLHKDFPLNITSAFQHKQYIYIIKGSIYYKVLVKRFPLKLNDEDMKGMFLFQDLLGCDDSLYTAWGFHSYDQFIENFAQKMQNGINPSIGTKESHFNPTFLIISLLVLALSSSALLMVCYLKPVWVTKVMQTLKAPFR